jgi:hypothetical protein
LYLANEAKAIGYGGISQVSKASGVSRGTITGRERLTVKAISHRQGRSRKKGGDRKLIETKTPEIQQELEGLPEPYTKGDP